MAFSAYDAAVHSIGRARGLASAAGIMGPRIRRDSDGNRVFRRGQLPSNTLGDMRRQSVVLAVAALDTYMHRLIIERAFNHKELPGGLASLEIGFDALLSQAEATDAAARAKPANPRSKVGVKRKLRDRLLRETFQNADAVSRAMGMAGRSKSWPKIAERMSPPQDYKALKEHLNRIVVRRNQIVHEGDYLRKERPRGPERNLMTLKQARADIDFVEELIDAIHAVVS